MKIISAKMRLYGKNLGVVDTPQKDIQKDMRLLEKKYKIACKEIPMFDMFGGTISIGNRDYQVV